MTRGITRVPTTIISPRNTAARNSAQPKVPSPASNRPSSGSRISRGTRARSCTSSMPIITRLESVPRRPWACRVLSTTMVLDRETQPPNHTDSCQLQPITRPSSQPVPMISSSWMGVPIRAMARTGRSSLSENSRPSANSSSATPISASSSMSWGSEIQAPPVTGPSTMPATM